MKLDSYSKNLCAPGIIVYNFTYNTLLGFTEETTFSATDNPAAISPPPNETPTASPSGTLCIVMAITSSPTLARFDESPQDHFWTCS